MKRFQIMFAIVTALALTVSLAAPAAAGTDSFKGTVIAVSDGDTLLISKGNSAVSVTLEAIDAPELGQEFGTEARDFLFDLAQREKVKVEVSEWTGKKAAVAKVTLGGENLAAEVVSAGFAWSASDDMKTAEQTARSAKKGLWEASSPTPPWQYRETQTTR